MQITTERIEPNVERITVQIENPDYQQEYKRELRKAASQSNVKGFRKGKVPLGFVEKTQGQSVLYQLIYNKLNEAVKDHLEKSDNNYLFDPLPAGEQKTYTFEPRDKEDYNFHFDVFIGPELNSFIGWDTDNEYEDYKLEVSDEEVDNKLMEFRRAYSEVIELEKLEDNEDKIGVKFEIEVPESEGAPAAEVQIKFLLEELQDDFREKLVGAEPGDEFEGSVEGFVLEKFRNAFDQSYSSAIEQGDEESETEEPIEPKTELHSQLMKWSVEEITGVKLPEVDEQFLKKVSGSGDPIGDEDELREKIKEMIQSEYAGVARSLIFKRLRDRLIEKNELDMPDKFLKEFIQKDKEKPLDEKARKNTIWIVFTSALAREKGIEITEEEIRSFLANQVFNWMGGQGDQNLIMGMVDRLLQDESAKSNAVENIFTGKMTEEVYKFVEKKEIFLDKEAFDELIEKEFPRPQEEEE